MFAHDRLLLLISHAGNQEQTKLSCLVSDVYTLLKSRYKKNNRTQTHTFVQLSNLQVATMTKPIVLLAAFLQICSGYKILVYSPGLSNSHLIFNGRIADLLINAGHDVVSHRNKVG